MIVYDESNLQNAFAISPLDGRYYDKCYQLQHFFSEYALIKYRVKIEIEYFIHLCGLKLEELQLNKDIYPKLIDIHTQFSMKDYNNIKSIEQNINHDVKAIEYFLQQKFDELNIKEKYFIHFGLTSQDINNTAYAIMIKEYLETLYNNSMQRMLRVLFELSNKWTKHIMISRTHGQPAVPTTMGKEFNVFIYRLTKQYNMLKKQKHYTKFSGAVGNFNAHILAYPNINWKQFSNIFINNLGLIRSKVTTQIDNYENLGTIFDNLKRINTILIDMCMDIWYYISIEYFKLSFDENEVGSSTMPHKINPINFENAEGNLMLANTLLEFFSRKLPISRLQRDLTDSTVLRNVGVIFGHIEVAFSNIIKGLSKLDINIQKINEDLNKYNNVLSEATQTLLRKNGCQNAYEQIKNITRGKQNFTTDINIKNYVGTSTES